MPALNNPHKFIGEKLSLWLIGLMWVLPLLSPGHQLPIPSFYSELTAFLLGLLALASLLQKSVWQDSQLPRIVLLPFGLICIILLQMALGRVEFPQMGLIGMQYLLWACLLMVLGQHLRNVIGWERLTITLSWFLVAGGFINAALAALQYAGVSIQWLFPKLPGQIFGNLGQPNHFADYMALATGSLVYLLGKQRVPWVAFWTLAATFLAVLALSGSRSSWLYLLAFPSLALFSQRANRNRENRRLLFACLALLPAFAVIQAILAWLLPMLGGEVHRLASERLFQQVSGSSVRLGLWQDALKMFFAHPWLGVGYGQFAWNTFLLADTHAPGTFSSPAEHAHNLPLHLLAELGVMGGLLLIVSGWVWIKAASKETFTLERWWMFALLTVLGIHSLLEYPLWYSYFLGIFAVLLGAGECHSLRPNLRPIGRPTLAAMMGFGFLITFAMNEDYSTLEKWTIRVISHHIQDSELPQFNQELLTLRQESLLAPYVDITYALAIKPKQEVLEQQLLLINQAVKFAPICDLVYSHARLSYLKGDLPTARNQFILAVRAYPAAKPFFKRKTQYISEMYWVDEALQQLAITDINPCRSP